MIAARPVPGTNLFELRACSFDGGITWKCVDDELPAPGLVDVPAKIARDIRAAGMSTTEEGRSVMLGQLLFDPTETLPILGGTG